MFACGLVRSFSALSISFPGIVGHHSQLRVLERKVELSRALTKSPVKSVLARRSWTVPLPHPHSKSLFTTRAMAQTSEADMPLIVVYITVPNKESATKLASGLVMNKLAACVNQVPGVVSTYMWEGKVETEEEILLIIKTRQSLLDALTVHVKANHPYTVPEVIALPILGGSDSYVKWVRENTKEQQDA